MGRLQIRQFRHRLLFNKFSVNLLEDHTHRPILIFSQPFSAQRTNIRSDDTFSFIFSNQNEFIYLRRFSIGLMTLPLLRPLSSVKRQIQHNLIIQDRTLVPMSTVDWQTFQLFPTFCIYLFSVYIRVGMRQFACVFYRERRSTRRLFLFCCCCIEYNEKKEKTHPTTTTTTKKRGEKMFSLFVSSFLLFFSQLSWYIAVLCISEHDIYIFQTRSLSILFHQFHVVLLFRLKTSPILPYIRISF